MAKGKLGGLDLTAATEALLYQPSASIWGSLSVRFVNRGTSTALVRLALSASGDASGTADDWLLYDEMLPPKSFLEVTGLVVGSQGKVFATSSLASVTATAYGYEGDE